MVMFWAKFVGSKKSNNFECSDAWYQDARAL